MRFANIINISVANNSLVFREGVADLKSGVVGAKLVRVTEVCDYDIRRVNLAQVLAEHST